MTKTRMEAFSDGVIAVIITIMVLELKLPEGVEWSSLHSVLPGFLVYVLSFIYVGIYWNNHHHLLMVCRRVNGRILWANLHLLFWLSLLPFVTSWMGSNHFTPVPSALYGSILLLASLAYAILQRLIVNEHGGCGSPLAMALGMDWKGKLSPVLYILGIGLSLFHPWMAGAVYVLVALLWLVPDGRLERFLGKSPSE